MPLVTVRKRLNRSREFTGIFRHHALRGLRGRHLLSGQSSADKEKRHKSLPKNHQEHSFSSSHSCLSPQKTSLLSRPNYALLFTTSSMLVPKSLSITVAAFRPGPPVTDPPGCVVAPV